MGTNTHTAVLLNSRIANDVVPDSWPYAFRFKNPSVKPLQKQVSFQLLLIF